jgi:hypothetical protein
MDAMDSERERLKFILIESMSDKLVETNNILSAKKFISSVIDAAIEPLMKWKQQKPWCSHISLSVKGEWITYTPHEIVIPENWDKCPVENCYVKRPE